jgi:lysophospholipase L1-like esterase
MKHCRCVLRFVSIGAVQVRTFCMGFFVKIASGLAIGCWSRCIGPRASVVSLSSHPHNSYRVFAFGDSLTAGYVPESPSEMYPYAMALREALAASLADDDDASKVIRVDHAGWPGWTSAALQEVLPNLPPNYYDIMIILAGTNDLGMGMSADTIAFQLRELHDTALRRGMPRTLAVEIPPSAYQQHYADARTLAQSINHSMREWNDARITVVPFPFPYDRQDPRWHQDGLHLTEQGYNALGQYLAPLVLRELQQQQQQVAS